MTGDPITQSFSELLRASLNLALFVVKESLVVTEHVLQIARLRAVDRWRINFRNDAAPQGKPYPTGG
jgi:hypothetical protein